MTKRRELLKHIRRHARSEGQAITMKEGANHTRLWLGERYTTIPRHNEIDNIVAEAIYKQLGMK